MPSGWIILDKLLAGAVQRSLLLIVLALTGCSLLPRTSTGNELMDAVLVKEDPFGDCVTVGGQTTILRDVGGPTDPPFQITAETFVDPGARTAAAAIAVSYRGFVRDQENLIHFGARDAENCMMDLSMPAYSGNFAFIDYLEPGGGIGVYAFRKDGSRWSVIEHKRLGNW